MSNYAPPSTNPANLDSLIGTLRTTFTKLMQGVAGMLPAEVVSFDRTKNRVSVQPLISMVDTNGNQIPRAKISSLPVFHVGGGGYILNFNLLPGDLGWIIANDRDISLFLQNYKKSMPNTFRVKDFADSVFLPHPMSGYTISPDDATATVLQSLDGTVKIALDTGKLTIKAPTVDIESANLNIQSSSVSIQSSGEVSVQSSASVTVTAPTIDADGNFNVSGLSVLGNPATALPIARAGDPVGPGPGGGLVILTGGTNKST